MFYCFYMFDSTLIPVISHCWGEQFTKWMVLIIYLDFALHNWYDLSLTTLIYYFNPSVIYESGLPKIKLCAKFRPEVATQNGNILGHFSHIDRFWVSLVAPYLLLSNDIRHTPCILHVCMYLEKMTCILHMFTYVRSE